jgi:hypothetical protein
MSPQTDACGRPLRDKELLRRIEQAKSTQRQFDPKAVLRDPIEKDPRIRPIVREVRPRAERESTIRGMGRCHDVWGRMQDILKNEHGLVWYPPSRMNTDIIFD